MLQVHLPVGTRFVAELLLVVINNNALTIFFVLGLGFFFPLANYVLAMLAGKKQFIVSNY